MKIDIENISFDYSPSANVLSDITLNVEGAQVISILGPNGVGKSTLIHCINKILEPTKGVVMIEDRDVSEYSLKEVARKIGYVPYSSSDTFPLTVVDTVLLGRHPHAGWRTTDNDLEIVFDVLEKLGIQDLSMRYFNELSAGQRQRVMLARGLVQKPEVIMLDEPTSNLDIKHQLGISRTLKQLSREEGILVIMISHDLNIAARYSDNIVLMHRGRVYAVGTPREVLTEDNIREVYGVDSRIIDEGGYPYIILRDGENDGCPPLEGPSVCRTSPQQGEHTVSGPDSKEGVICG
ncbi:MAG: ABC transporter ATP-binding protein [Candidatus Methanomethylophilaceae archaeon]|nr:ABC transporter ATP-binding protein [Candidatus Methanomethylophilaceae archaeon]